MLFSKRLHQVAMPVNIPPERSYEATTRNQELFAFRWESVYFKRTMYVKFSLAKADGEDLVLRLHSLHPNR